MNIDQIIFSAPISVIWKALGGDAPRRGRARAFYRGGDNPGAISLSDEKGCWHDFVSGEGGGVLALVQTALKCDRREALRWLVSEGFLADEKRSPAQRREHARTHIAAATVARDIISWRDALINEVNRLKLEALETFDDQDLARTAALCNLLENGRPQDIAREFARHRQADPGDVARLIGIGREREFECLRVTGVVVSLLVLAAGAEVDRAG